jgi:hypothetical protein
MGNYSHAKHIHYVNLVHPVPFSEKNLKFYISVAGVSAVMFSTAARISALSFQPVEEITYLTTGFQLL